MPVCLDELSEAAPDGTPPASPTKASSSPQQRSLLFPPDEYAAAQRDDLRLFYLTAQQLIAALDFTSCQPLPAPDLMFPWLHGLHPENEIQQCFFMGRKRSLRIVPSCSRGILLVKASGSLSISRLKGAISPDEFMMTDSQPQFIEADPSDGFSVRNFQIQTAKAALISDVVIYGEDSEENENIAWDIAAAQMHQRQKQEAQPAPVVEYNTFVCDGPFSDFEQLGSHLVAIDSDGRTTGNVLDFVQQERNEMWNMTRASEISHNVYLGPSPEPGSIEERMFGVQIECSDSGQLNPKSLQDLALGNHVPATGRSYFDFPSSGSILPPTWSHDEADGIIETCRWIYHLAHGTQPEPDQGECTTASGSKARKLGNSVQRRILIHCADGYTESTLLGIAYHSYSTGLPVPYAWLDLHTTKRRNFFAYPTDVSLLTAIAPRLLQDSPIHVGQPPSQMTSLLGDEPKWLPALDGSFPSRILDYLYLGNLGHANNPALLRELGIGQVLSVGETASWREGEVEDWGPDNICNVHGVQDNGIDPLTGEFPGCLDFIGMPLFCKLVRDDQR